jgi:galactose mutarotase-like enzyme
MNVSLEKTTWHGLSAWALESELLRTVIVPELGGKLVSLVDKRNQLEWLVDAGLRPFQPVPYGASFVEQDMSGWDEMFPTIVACAYPVRGEKYGTPLPDHGEVWTQPWTVEPAQPGLLRLGVLGKALSYRLIRTLSFSNDATLRMHYELKNLSSDRVPYIWAAHPQFVCGDQAEILLPPQVTEVCNTIPAEWGWSAPETRFGWPEAVNVNGQRVHLNYTGPASLRQARKFFVLPGTRVGWAGLVRHPAGDWLRLDWDPTEIPYLGIWVDEGALNHTTVAALEPTTGFYDSLEVACQKNEVSILEPGATHTWTLTVRTGSRLHPFPTNL